MKHPGAAIEISLLGPWQMTGGLAKEPRRKEQALLAYLAVEADQPHSRDSLVGLFWPDMPVTDARNNLRVALSRLKRHLGDSSSLETTRHTISFTSNNQVQLDVNQFLTLINTTGGHDHTSLSTCQPCLDRLKQAVELYHGEFLAGFYLEDCLVFEEWLFIWRERLHVQMLKQLDLLVQAAENSNHFADAESYARRQIELDPLYENAHRQLMRALVGQGQRSAALNQFQVCKTVLQDELGVEPEPETLLLHQQIQAGTFAVAPSAVQMPTAFRPDTLPENTTPFIGREVELDQLRQRFTDRSYRLISLVGPGGMGKTRLALQAARTARDAFRDGVFFVPLDGVQTAAEIPAAIAESLGVTFSRSESPQVEIIHILHDKQLLLVIDNLEHVIEQGAELLLEIIQTTQKVVLLITSREQVNVQGEDLFRLRGLPYPDTDTDPDLVRYAAVRLFVNRAHRIDKDFGLSESTLSQIVQICRLVEGLPLGLELAATWVRDFSVKEIAASLAKNLDLLKTDMSDISPRHRSMAAIFEHSWALLTPAQQAVLPQLAVFRGGFTVVSAQKVTGVSSLELTRLRYKSLLRGSGNGRYTIHELLRQLALRKLNEHSAITQQTQTRHSRYFLGLLQEQADRLKGTTAAQAGAALRLEIDNIRRAWRWAVENSALAQLRQSATGLVSFFVHEGLGFEVAQLLQMAIDSSEVKTAQDDLLPYLLTKQLTALESISTLDEINAIIERILSLTRQNPALSYLEAETYLVWSLSVLDKMSDTKQARVYLDQAFSLSADLDDPELEARLHCESGRNYLYGGQFDEAVVVLQKSLTLFEDLGHLPGQALVYSRLAPAYAEAYNLGPALTSDREALRLYTQINNRTRLGIAHLNLAETYILLGAYEQAQEHTLKSLKIARQRAIKIDEANSICQYAIILDRLGQLEEAEKQYQASIAAQKTLKLNSLLRFSLLEWGDFQLRAGRLTEAEITFDEAITINSDNPHLYLTSQAKQAMVYQAQGKIRAALALADKVWQEIEPTGGVGFPFPLNTMYECYSIFQAADDVQAEVALQMAADVLKRTAAGIIDPEMRTAFLSNVPVNRQLRTVLHEDQAEIMDL